ncbi:nucleoside hydrolase-like domain-containing protein [Streptococcus moroccensis]|uniref:Beta-galactosidase n=1 Tax=Streptococcus moroccensis TaxID=1451356 RepID=A0ABT9YR98_9STRE|nr:nucleoside hydrolase-like domain-containing protein [Streptococcus moroccensis]MDQ0222422.1 hypothetical protein [Streptococcus moroccensis]
MVGDGYYLEGEIDKDQFGQQEWLDTHPDYDRYDFISERDSPSYFNLLQTGLRGFEHPSFGGWGGRFTEINPKTYTTEKAIDYNPKEKRFEQEYNLYRWIKDIQSDFAARAKWCVAATFEEASHYPEIDTEMESMSAKPGEEVTLKVSASDPNGFALTYNWWCYHEASTYWDFSHIALTSRSWKLGNREVIDSWHSEQMENNWSLPLTNSDTKAVSFVIPEDAKTGDTIHMIAEVSNQTELPLKSYRRIIVTVA